VELLTTASNTNNFEDVADTILSLDQGAKHICEEGTLSKSCPGSSFAKVSVLMSRPEDITLDVLD
jgi:hypothetical protein